MDLNKFIESMEIYTRATSQDDMRQSSEYIMEFLQNPQSIFYLFQLLESDSSNMIKQMSSILINKYMGNNYHLLRPDIQNTVFSKLLYYYFKDNTIEVQAKNLCNALYVSVKWDDSKFGLLMNYIGKIRPFVDLLSKIINKIDKNNPTLQKNKEKFFEYSLIGLRSGQIASSAELYFNLKELGLSIEDEPHLDIIVDLIQNFDNVNGFHELLDIFEENVQKNIVPKEKLSEILANVVENSLSEEQLGDCVNFLLNTIDHFNLNEIEHIFDIFCYALPNLIEDILADFDSYFSFSLSKDKIDGVTKIIRKKIEENVLGDLTIILYSILLLFNSNDFYLDKESFEENLSSALETNNNINVNIALILISKYQTTFPDDETISCKFMKKMVQLIPTEINSIAAISKILPFLTVNIPWLWKSIFSLMKSNIYRFEALSAVLYESLFICDTASPDEIKMFLEFILSESNNFKYIELFPFIMKNDEDSISILLPKAIEFFKKNRNSPLYFIKNFFETFGSKYVDQFQFIIDEFQRSELIELYLIKNCSYLAKAKNDKELAKAILKKIMIYLETIMKDKDKVKSSDEFLDTHKIVAVETCINIVKLLDRKDAKKLLFHVFLFILTTNDQYYAGILFSLAKKILTNACEEDKQIIVKKFIPVVERVFSGKLNAFDNNGLLDADLDFIDDFCLFISKFIICKSPINEKIYDFVLDVIKTSINAPYIISFIPICCSIFNNKVGTEKVYDEIINLVPALIQAARIPPLKHNVAFLLGSIANFDENALQKVVQFVPTLQNWYIEEKKAEYVNKEMISNIALAFFSFLVNGMKMDTLLLNEALNEYPPADLHDTSKMSRYIMNIFAKNEFDGNTVKNACLALSRLVVLNDYDLQNRRVSNDLMEEVQKLLISLLESSPELKQILLDEYKDSSKKSERIKSLLK